jgi:hypothetical protein
MTWKEVLKKNMKNSDKVTNFRYKSSKILFILGAFLFFINFFFVGANFYPNIFTIILPYTYILFCISICVLIFYFLREKILKSRNVSYSIWLWFCILILCTIIVLPVFFKWGIFYFVTL